MSRKTYIYPQELNLGKGVHMKPENLKKVLLYAVDHRQVDVEKHFGIKHGLAANIMRKIKDWGLSYSDIEKSTPSALAKRYYKRAPRTQRDPNGKSRKIIDPNIKELVQIFKEEDNYDGTKSDNKTKLTKKLVIELYYFRKPENL